MLGITHAVLAGASVVPVAIISASPLTIGIGMICGLLPDLDASEATIKHLKIPLKGKGRKSTYIKPFYFLSVVVSALFPHRGALHSIYPVLIIGFIIGLLFNWSIGLAAAIGYLSHILLDACTPAGVPLLGKKKWNLLPPKYQIPTGSIWEHLFVAIGALIILTYTMVWSPTYQSVNPTLITPYL